MVVPNLTRRSVVIGVLVVIALLVGGYFALAQKGASRSAVQDGNVVARGDVVHTAWVEVQGDPVSVIDNSGKTALRSGDMVNVGAEIVTGATGSAVIHFPDGSLARVDKNTTLTLSSIAFATADDSLVASIGLSVGRVWSKVIGLATPESKWAVTTSNVVATVRGTAFAVGFKGDASFVLGSEHTVAVAPIHPATHAIITSAEAILAAGQLLQWRDLDSVEASMVNSSLIAAKITQATPIFRTDPWIRANQIADKEFNAMIEALRTPNDTEASWRKKIREADMALRNRLIEQRSAVTEPKKTVPTTTTATEATPVSVPVATSSPTASILIVRADASLDDLIHGDTVQFHALVKKEGEWQETTDPIRWEVDGPVGSINAQGLFTAALAQGVARADGYVLVIRKNSEVIRSNEITVEAKPAGSSPNSLQ